MSLYSHDQLQLPRVSELYASVTIDTGAKYAFSGASATPECKELSIQGPTTSLLHQCVQQCDRQLLCFSPHRGPHLYAAEHGPYCEPILSAFRQPGTSTNTPSARHCICECLVRATCRGLRLGPAVDGCWRCVIRCVHARPHERNAQHCYAYNLRHLYSVLTAFSCMRCPLRSVDGL